MELITFSEEIKKEITTLEFNSCCKKSLLSSFLVNSIDITLDHNGQKWEIRSQYPFIITFIATMFEELYNITKKISYSEIKKINNHRLYIAEFTGDLDYVYKDLKLESSYMTDKLDQCCQRAYVAGGFLSAGSISSLERRGYHLEIRAQDSHYLRVLQKQLLDFNIGSVIYKRKKWYMIYIKKAEYISDFLKLISAQNSFLKFEDIKIQRDFNVQIVRLNNIDVSNMKKSVEAGNRQVEQIKKIQSMPLYNKQSKNFRFFCEARVKNPGASLNEIGIILKQKNNIDITKSGLNHFVRKLNNLID